MRFKFEQYNLLTTWDQDAAIELARAIIGEQVELEQVFRDNKQTFIGRFRARDQHLVLKIPRGRNARTWQRFLTWFRSGECEKVYESHLKLQSGKLRAPAPILAAEKRKLGVVVDSFLVYEFVEGRIADESDAQAVVNTLLELHAMGYIRRDPQLANFVIRDGEIFLIDFKLLQPLLFTRLHTFMELTHFLSKYPHLQLDLPENLERSIWYRVAVQIFTFKRLSRNFRRGIKRYLKRKLGLNKG